MMIMCVPTCKEIPFSIVFDNLTSVLQNQHMLFKNRVRCKQIACVVISVLSILALNVAIEQRQEGQIVCECE